MKKEIIILFVNFILIISILSISSAENNNKIDENIYETLEKNKDAKVIVEIKEPSVETGVIFKTKKSQEKIENEKEKIKADIEDKIDDNIKHDFGNEIAIEVSKKELIELSQDPNIKSIELDKPVRAILADSVPLINASAIWPVRISNLNITGIDETVCIIDTGVNFMHSDLIGKNKTCVIDCVGKTCVPNCAIADDNGHGTHIAGIIAANGGIRGVAIGANLIGVKALDSSGSGSSSDIDAAIDWCINNSVAYNISVISMSLGADCDDYPQYCYNVYCDYDWITTARRIDNATSRNISVIIATGNDGKTINISAPACIKNATAVAATNKDDTIASYSNRNNLTDLVAPGTSITSTSSSGSYISYSGTSMATPHVAGAFALVREFFSLQYNRKPTPLEILNLLNSTGKQINDTSGNGLMYSRTDVYSALISNDSLNPSVNLTSPLNTTTQFNSSVIFRCTANDVLLSNLSLYVWNSTKDIINITNHPTNCINAEEQFNLDLNYGDYKWNCLAYDSKAKSSFASSNFSLTLTSLNSNLISPTNNSYINIDQTFNCSAESESSKSLKNVTFYIWNSTGYLFYNATQNISGILNSSVFYYNFTNEFNYYWNCKIFNNNSDSIFANQNFTITYDVTKPSVVLVSPDNASSYSSDSQSIIFNYNVSDNFNIANCSLIINDAVSLTSYSITNLSITQSLTQSFSPGNYNWSINCTDSAGNLNNSDSKTFSVSAPASVIVSNSGGGGGGSPSYNLYSPNVSETSTGYTKELSKEDKVQFVFFDATSLKHTLTINQIKKDFVNITIKSNTITFLLGVGQSIKLNLTSANYYDLYVKLDGIQNNKAKITIQTIHEEIPKHKAIPVINETKEIEKPLEESQIQTKNYLDYLKNQLGIIGIYLLVVSITFITIIILAILIKRRKNNKKKKKKLKEYNEIFNNHLKPKK